jgi:hypothetical protein
VRINGITNEVAQEGIRDSEDPDIMLHPADAEAWHALDRFDLKFARDPRSVRIGLLTDGFQPYSSDITAYSCWSVFCDALQSASQQMSE